MAGLLSDRHCHLFSTKFTLVFHINKHPLSLVGTLSLITLSCEDYGGLSSVRKNNVLVPTRIAIDSGARAIISTHGATYAYANVSS